MAGATSPRNRTELLLKWKTHKNELYRLMQRPGWMDKIIPLIELDFPRVPHRGGCDCDKVKTEEAVYYMIQIHLKYTPEEAFPWNKPSIKECLQLLGEVDTMSARRYNCHY